MKNRLIACIIFCTVYICSAHATTKVATTSGNWSNPTLWSPAGMPTSSDNVIINPGIIVFYDVNVILVAPASVTVNGILCGNNFFKVSCGGNFVVNGIMSGVHIELSNCILNGTAKLYAADTLIIDTCGTLTVAAGASVIMGQPFSCNPLSISENNTQKIFTVSPNPLTTQSTLIFNNPSKEKFLFTLYDITGRPCVGSPPQAEQGCVITYNDKIILEKGSKRPGIYLFNLTNQKTGIRMNGKIVIQ